MDIKNSMEEKRSRNEMVAGGLEGRRDIKELKGKREQRKIWIFCGETVQQKRQHQLFKTTCLCSSGGAL